MTWVDAVERYSRLVISVPRRHGITGHNAEDILQSTWQKAFELSEQPPAEETFVRWIVSIASWTTRRFLSTGKRLPTLMPDLDKLPPEDSRALLELIEALEEEQMVRDAVEALPQRDRRLVTELFLAPQNVSYDEMARLLGVAGGSVGALRGRALARLRRELGQRGIFS